jgi:hypothetical protein
MLADAVEVPTEGKAEVLIGKTEEQIPSLRSEFEVARARIEKELQPSDPRLNDGSQLCKLYSKPPLTSTEQIKCG